MKPHVNWCFDNWSFDNGQTAVTWRWRHRWCPSLDTSAIQNRIIGQLQSQGFVEPARHRPLPLIQTRWRILQARNQGISKYIKIDYVHTVVSCLALKKSHDHSRFNHISNKLQNPLRFPQTEKILPTAGCFTVRFTVANHTTHNAMAARTGRCRASFGGWCSLADGNGRGCMVVLTHVW